MTTPPPTHLSLSLSLLVTSEENHPLCQLLTVETVRKVRVSGGKTENDVEVDEKTCEGWLDGRTLLIDALPLEEVKARLRLHAAARTAGIPIVTAATLVGCGSSVTVFLPERASLATLCGATETDDEVAALARAAMVLLPQVDLTTALNRVENRQWLAEQTIRVARLVMVPGSPGLPLAPRLLAHTPSTGVARLTSGPANNAFSRTAHFLRLRSHLRRHLPLLQAALDPYPTDDLSFILDAARWAPTVDNRQRTRVSRTVPTSSSLTTAVPKLPLDNGAVLLYVSLEKSEVDAACQRGNTLVWMELAAFIENARLAAAARGKEVWYVLPGGREGESEGDEDEIEALLVIADTACPAPTADFARLPPATVGDEQVDTLLRGEVRRRHTDRRSFRTTPISSSVRTALTDLTRTLDVVTAWHSSRRDRWTLARLNHRSYATRSLQDQATSDIGACSEWRAYSETKMPGKSMGVSRHQLPMARLFCTHPHAWRSLARYGPPGTNALSNLDVALIPPLRTGVYLTLSLSPATPWSRAALLRAGVAMHRVWLFTSAAGLALQPTLAPIVFAWSADNGTSMACQPHAATSARLLVDGLRAFLATIGTDSTRCFAQLRIGFARSPLTSRSLRLPLSHLWATGEEESGEEKAETTD